MRPRDQHNAILCHAENSVHGFLEVIQRSSVKEESLTPVGRAYVSECAAAPPGSPGRRSRLSREVVEGDGGGV